LTGVDQARIADGGKAAIYAGQVIGRLYNQRPAQGITVESAADPVQRIARSYNVDLAVDLLPGTGQTESGKTDQHAGEQEGKTKKQAN
jgi:hypothetical protein